MRKTFVLTILLTVIGASAPLSAQGIEEEVDLKKLYQQIDEAIENAPQYVAKRERQIEDHSNIELYYSDYKDLIEKYTEKYGKPLYSSGEWIGDSVYKNKPEKYGMAVGLGELQLSARWAG